eukprot:g54766.t1
MTDCDFVALEKGHPTWPRPAFNLLRVAIGVVGVLLVSAFGWVVSQHFAQAPDKGVDSAQAGVDSAQAGVDFAQARVNNAQVLVDECIQRQANMNREPAAGKAAEVPWKSDATATKYIQELVATPVQRVTFKRALPEDGRSEMEELHVFKLESTLQNDEQRTSSVFSGNKRDLQRRIVLYTEASKEATKSKIIVHVYGVEEKYPSEYYSLSLHELVGKPFLPSYKLRKDYKPSQRFPEEVLGKCEDPRYEAFEVGVDAEDVLIYDFVLQAHDGRMKMEDVKDLRNKLEEKASSSDSE